jgi:hypothetical protein
MVYRFGRSASCCLTNNCVGSCRRITPERNRKPDILPTNFSKSGQQVSSCLYSLKPGTATAVLLFERGCREYKEPYRENRPVFNLTLTSAAWLKFPTSSKNPHYPLPITHYPLPITHYPFLTGGLFLPSWSSLVFSTCVSIDCY